MKVQQIMQLKLPYRLIRTLTFLRIIKSLLQVENATIIHNGASRRFSVTLPEPKLTGILAE